MVQSDVNMFDGDAVIEALAIVLHDVVSANEASRASSDAAAAAEVAAYAPLVTTPAHQREVTKFCSSYAPTVPIEAYLHRIRQYAKCSDSCFIVALIYTDRVINSHKFNLTRLNVHRMILTAVLLAAKFLDDTYYNNSFYAQLGGIGLSEMNALELEFLALTRFELNVTESHFGQYYANLKGYAGLKLPHPPLSLYVDVDHPCAAARVVTPPAQVSSNMWAAPVLASASASACASVSASVSRIVEDLPAPVPVSAASSTDTGPAVYGYGWYQSQQASAYDMSYDMPAANMDADADACSSLSSFNSVYADVSDDDDLNCFPACSIPTNGMGDETYYTDSGPSLVAMKDSLSLTMVIVPELAQPLLHSVSDVSDVSAAACASGPEVSPQGSFVAQAQTQAPHAAVPVLTYPGWNSSSINWKELSRWAPAVR